MIVEVSALVEVAHQEVGGTGVAQRTDFAERRGGADARLLFTAGAEVYRLGGDRAGPILGDPLDALARGCTDVSPDRVER